MATPPPSRYMFESEMDFQIEMALWCEENEPHTRYVGYIWYEGAEHRVECSREEHLRRPKEAYPIPQEVLDKLDAEYEHSDPYTRRKPGERMGGSFS